MNTIVTSKKEILAASRALILENGIVALNMRTVAARCQVAVGSVYYYFPSKAALINAAVEDVWEDIFRMDDLKDSQCFPECVRTMFANFTAGARKYPGFFTLHSMGFAYEDRASGRQTMDRFFLHLQQLLQDSLARDPKVKQEAFTGSLNRKAFIGIVISSCIALTLEGKSSCDALLEMIRRCIY